MILDKNNIHEIDKFLTPIESIILKMRWGFGTSKRKVKDCADLFQVSSTRICHIQQRAMRKLSHIMVPEFIRNHIKEINDEKWQKFLKKRSQVKG